MKYLPRLGITNKFAHFLECLRSCAINKSNKKKMTVDYNYFSLFFHLFNKNWSNINSFEIMKTEHGGISFLFH